MFGRQSARSSARWRPGQPPGGGGRRPMPGCGISRMIRSARRSAGASPPLCARRASGRGYRR